MGRRWGFGDSQSMAIGVGNNGISGPDRAGARNQRRAPSVLNSAFYPRQMLNGRFESLSGDSFDNSLGFKFPAPEGLTKFPPNDPVIRLLRGRAGAPAPDRPRRDGGLHGHGGHHRARVRPVRRRRRGRRCRRADASGYRNEPIRAAVVARFNESAAYRPRFARAFGMRPLPPGGIDFPMIANALAEFQASLTFTNAPIDRFARGWRSAMTPAQKRGALLVLRPGALRRVPRAWRGGSNEMFSDFREHVVAVPQIAPVFGVDKGNVKFDGPDADEDFGAEQVTGDPADRYAFRTSPLRNVSVQPAFFHNGAFTQIEDAIRHHLDVAASSGRLRSRPRRARPGPHPSPGADPADAGSARPHPGHADRPDRRRVRTTSWRSCATACSTRARCPTACAASSRSRCRAAWTSGSSRTACISNHLSMPFRHFLEVRMRVAANSLKLGAVLVVSTTALAAGFEPPHLPGGRGAVGVPGRNGRDHPAAERVPLPRRHRRRLRRRRRQRRGGVGRDQRRGHRRHAGARGPLHERGRPLRRPHDGLPAPARRPRRCAGGRWRPTSPGRPDRPTAWWTCSSPAARASPRACS